MLSDLVFDATIPAEQRAIVTPDDSLTWLQLRIRAQEMFGSLQGVRRRRIGLTFRPEGDSYAALAALHRLESDVFVIDASLPNDEARQLAKGLRLGALLTKSSDGSFTRYEVQTLGDEAAWSGHASIVILTSGSTGRPKAAQHSWEGIARPIRKGALEQSPVWLLSYRPQLYAGLQVMLQCFSDRGTLVIPGPNMDPRACANFMANQGVEYVSATPSYWRRLLMFAPREALRAIPIKQITIGGEVVDQPLLEQLKRIYPTARLVHIYATTELGRCFAVVDGLAGFPTSYLNNVLQDGTELKVCDGELFVKSKNSMQKYDPLSSQQSSDAEWFATADLVTIVKDRVYFAGRKSEMINVAGTKVYPAEVERVIRTVPGVFDVRVFGKTSSIAGELVACEIVPEKGTDPIVLKESVSRTCRSELASSHQPRSVKFVEKFELSAAGKTVRTKI